MRRGGPVIPRDEKNSYDLNRLERAVSVLAESHAKLQDENTALRGELEDRALRMRTLDEQLIQSNQRRQDAVKRIDELIAQMDQLDTQLESLET